MENLKYYKITEGNIVKLYTDYNFKGTSIWLNSTFGRQLKSEVGKKEFTDGIIDEEQQINLQKFKSFEIFSDSEAAQIRKDCQGYWEECDYNNNNELVSKWITTENEKEEVVGCCSTRRTKVVGIIIFIKLL